MKKVFGMILCLVLFMSIPAGCAQEQGAKMSLTKTQIKQLQDAWYAQEGVELRWNEEEDRFYGLRYYGTYHGYAVFLDLDAQVGGYSVNLAGEELSAEHVFEIYTYRDGELCPLYFAYEQGYLTAEDISAIAKIHRAAMQEIAQDDAAKEQITLPLPTLEPLSNEAAKEVEDAWYAETGHTLTLNDDPGRFGGMEYYGTCNGYVILFSPGDITVVTELKLGGETFRYPRGFSIFAYRDGVFYNPEYAYENEYLTRADIAVIAQRHRDANN